MGGVGLALVALLLIAPHAREPADEIDWPQVWSELAAVRAGSVDGARRAAHVDALAAIRARAGATPRGVLLGCLLVRLAGGEARLDLPPAVLDHWPTDSEETWLVAEVLAAGPARADALRRALATSLGALPGTRLRLAWEVGVEEALALRLRVARSIQASLHERYQAPWSAMDLSLTLNRLGQTALAESCLALQIDIEEAARRPSGDLWSQRGILALGSGDERRARDYLGFGCARGSADAGVVLARLDLDRGRLAAARAGFRALLLDDDPSPWAPRGWGLSLLPPAGSQDQER